MTSWNIDFYAIDQTRETCTDFDPLYEYTSFIWPSFVYHSRLAICDCLRFTKVCFCPYTPEKQFYLNDINASVMSRLDEKQRLRAIGMLYAGLAQNVVAIHFGCHRNTILSLWRRIRQSGNTRDCRRLGRPRVTSRRQDNHIRLVHLRNRNQVSLLEAFPDYDRSALEQSAIDFANITSGQDVPQSVQLCCLDTVQLGWRGVDVI